jgi:small subunit ribosomal protein S15
MIQKEEKKKIISNFKKSDKDTGSSMVQIALYTKRIQELLEHFKKHPKDNSSKRGLVQLVNKRRSLLRYLEGENNEEYKKTIAKLELKK